MGVVFRGVGGGLTACVGRAVALVLGLQSVVALVGMSVRVVGLLPDY